MTTRLFLLSLLTAATVACGTEGQTVPAEEPTVGAPEAAPAAGDQASEATEAMPDLPEVASYSVPGLDEGSAQAMAAALQGVPGMLKATPMVEEGRLEVMFQPPEANTDAILAAVSTVNASASLVDVRPADPHSVPGHDCSQCPKTDCPHAKEHAE